MKRTLFLAELLFVIGLLATVFLIRSNTPARQYPPAATQGIVQLLTSGRQIDAENKVAIPKTEDELFWKAVLLRSRFNITAPMSLFIQVMRNSPDSPQGLASACIVGVDLSRSPSTALYYFNALMILADEHPESIPIHWMAAVMARTLTRREFSPRDELPSEMYQRVLLCGVSQYEKALELMAPGKGPVLIHQTLGNLFDSLEIYDKALQQREITLSMERKPWSLHAAAVTCWKLGRNEEALSLIKEAISMEEANLDRFRFLSSKIALIQKGVEGLKRRFPTLEQVSSALQKLQISMTTPFDLQKYYGLEGEILWDLDRGTDAIAVYEKVARMNPSYQWVQKACMESLSRLGRYEDAKKYSRQAVINEPWNRSVKIWDARLAVLTGEPGAGDRLIQAGQFDFRGNPEAYKNPSTDPWFAAVERGDFKKVRAMIPTVDINRPDAKSFGQTALMTASQVGWEPILKDLLRAGAKTDLVDANGDTALHYSVQFSQPRMAKLLLEAGAGTDFQDKWHQTPLIMSAFTKDWEIVRMLLEKKPNVNLASPFHGTPLHSAAGFGQLSMVQALIVQGADVNVHRERGGDTPLIAAAKYHHCDVIQPLLSAGADINARDDQGWTALHWLILPQLDFPFARMLLEKGADPTIADTNGITPINKARLLGYEEFAAEMEARYGHSEYSIFPSPEPTNSSLTLEENNASLFILPLRMARGYFPGVSGGFPPSRQKEAASELSSGFGIKDASGLTKTLALLVGGPELLYEGGRLSLKPKDDQIQNMLTGAVWKIHDSCTGKTKDDAAWTYSRIIYLAKLGASAGYLSRDDSARRIGEAAKVITGRFSSWQQFLDSFLLGVQSHEEWDEPRCKWICRRISEAAIPWPKAVSPAVTAPEPSSAPQPAPITVPTPSNSPIPQTTPVPQTKSSTTPANPPISEAVCSEPFIL